MRILPNTSTQNQYRKSNPRALYLQSDTLLLLQVRPLNQATTFICTYLWYYITNVILTFLRALLVETSWLFQVTDIGLHSTVIQGSTQLDQGSLERYSTLPWLDHTADLFAI